MAVGDGGQPRRRRRTLLRALHPLLSRSPVGGRVVLIGSKNVPAPGPGAAAYSASKAAMTQLARVAALEWAADGIRVNTVHPDAVFDTGLWTDELLAERAAKYGMTVEQYKQRNLLGVGGHVRRSSARLVAEMCGDTFANTTGAQIPIDGGNERADLTRSAECARPQRRPWAQRATKYLACGWWQMIADVVCSGWYCQPVSSLTSMPSRSASSSSATVALSSRSGHAG